MSTTPSEWLQGAIIATPDGSSDADPRVLGLSNGNVLYAWVESNATIAPDDGRDIVGIIYDARGNAISSLLQLSSGSYPGSIGNAETDAEYAATYDGGFMMVFQENEGSLNSIRVARFDDQGTVVSGTAVAVGSNIPDEIFFNPDIVASNDGTFLISYERDADGALIGVFSATS